MAAYLDSCFIMHDGQVKKYCHFADFGQVKEPLQCVKIQYNPFSIIVMTPRGTFELCCVYTAQLMTHTAIYTQYRLPCSYVTSLLAYCRG